MTFDGELIKVGFWKSDGFATPKAGPGPGDDWLSGVVGRSMSTALQRAFLAAVEGSLPSVFEHIDHEWDYKERDLVIGYLKRGEFRTMSYLGDSICRICGKKNGCADYSDGKFIWPEGLAHYLRDHAVRPPPQFVRHVVRRNTR